MSDPANPDALPFLTILQPSAKSGAAMATALVTVHDGPMLGAIISQPGSAASIVLFTNQPGRVPTPVTSVSYDVPTSAISGSHTLCGLMPGAAYAIERIGSMIQVTRRTGGKAIASAAGVLQFTSPP